VLGFLGCAAVGSTGLVPASALGWISHLQVVTLGAALFGMGCSVHLTQLLRKGGAVMVLSTAATLFVLALSLAGILVLAP
jgi:uncharacterized membrane protein YadS